MTKRPLAALLTVAIAVVGCSGGKKGSPPGPPDSGGAGLGSSTAAPTGTPYAPPANVAFGTLSSDTSTSCSAAPVYGNGDFVEFCLPVVYTGAGTAAVTLPAGLVFVSSDLGTQNGMIVSPISLTVSPGTTTIRVRAYCLNLGREASAAFQPDYAIGPDTNVAALEALIALVATKNPSATIPAGSMPAGSTSMFGDPYASYETWPAYWLIQDMIWTITEGGALSTSDRAALAALP